MLKLSLKHQLVGAFFSLTALVLIVGVIGGLGSRTLGGIFTDYRGASLESLSLNTIKLELVQARIAGFQWRTSGNPERADEFSGYVDTTVQNLDALGMPEAADHAREYQAAFMAAVQHQAERERQFEILAETGTAIRARLSDVMESAYADGDAEASYFTGLAQEKLLLSRFYAERFLTDNAEASAVRAISELNAAQNALNTLLTVLENPQRRSLTQESLTGVNRFADAFNAIRDAINARNSELAHMDSIGPLLTDAVDIRRLETVDRQDSLGAQAEKSSQTTQVLVFGSAVISVAFAIILAFFLARSITGAIKRAVQAMRELSGGNKQIEINGVERSDELGDMARALTVFRDNALEMDRLQAEQAAAEERTARERKDAMMALADQFENQVGSVIQSLSDAAVNMQSRSQTLNESVDDTNERASSVAAAAEQASGNVEAVASAAEELTASIREIATQVTSSSNAVQASNERAAISSQQLDRLNEAVAGADEIVQAINAVADQTNLLALNATIEAARAGEAGKGFAVVASEVKALAEQTQKLTEEIADRLSDIGRTSTDAINATREIISQVREIDTTTQALASAVEEQTAATGEISSNAQQAAQGTRTVTVDVTGIQGAVSQTTTVSEEVNTAAKTLKTSSEHLRSEVERFLETVRAA